MRPTQRLFAAVKGGRFLEAGTPTGLTGLRTHPSPRPQLLYLYSQILEGLKGIPESSVYRQSTEALTKQRLQIVEQIKPAGYEEWTRRAKAKIEEFSDRFNGGPGGYSVQKQGDSLIVQIPPKRRHDLDATEWEGERGRPYPEGIRRDRNANILSRPTGIPVEERLKPVNWEPEPKLEAIQISDIENKIGAGLIEEVIQVAEGELKLVNTMVESRAWEELEEKPLPGQWEYFDRSQHNPETTK